MPDEKAPSSGAFLLASLMYFCSGQPMHYCSGVDTWKGIYVLDGDTLTICDNAPNLDEGRPVSFETKSGSGYEVITFKRAAPDRA